MLSVACCVLRVACCVLRVACCVLRVACCVDEMFELTVQTGSTLSSSGQFKLDLPCQVVDSSNWIYPVK